MKLEEHDSKYQLFVDRVTEALTDLGGATGPIKGSQIYEWVAGRYPKDTKMLDPSWGSHLSRATQDEDTRIRRVPGKYTYLLLPLAPAGQELPVAEPAPVEATVPEPTGGATSCTTAAEVAKYTKREAALYPVLRDWLSGRGFRAEDTSRSKAGGTWGNPDVCGLKISEDFLGRRDLELATIEAKTSMGGWRQLIFEAVSHKRFAHRAYFAFAFGSDEPSVGQLPELGALRRYAERFRVGILVVFLPAEVFHQLHLDKVGEIKVETAEVRVEELWPAIYEDVRSEETTHYLWKVLGLETDEALYAFGRE